MTSTNCVRVVYSTPSSVVFPLSTITQQQSNSPIQQKKQKKKKKTKKLVGEKLIRHREVSKLNQRRHRETQRKLIQDGQRAIEELLVQQAKLQAKKNYLSTCLERQRPFVLTVNKQGHLAQYVQDYYSLSKNGYNPESFEDKGKQLALLNYGMDQQVQLGRGLGGIETIMQQWSYISCNFRYVTNNIHIIRVLSHDEGYIVEIFMEHHLMITQASIANLYPHLLHYPYVQQHVVGKVIEVPVHITQMYNKVGKCEKMNADMNLVDAWLKCMNGDLDLVDIILNKGKQGNHFIEKTSYEG